MLVEFLHIQIKCNGKICKINYGTEYWKRWPIVLILGLLQLKKQRN